MTDPIAGIASELRRIRQLLENQQKHGQDNPLTETEAAEYCRVGIETLRYYSKRLQEIPYIKLGRERFYYRTDLDQFLRSKRVAVKKVR